MDSSIWDWNFFWECFRFFIVLVGGFIMLVVAINAVGAMLENIIKSVRK